MAKDNPIKGGGGNSHQRSVARQKTDANLVAVPAIKEAITHKSFKSKLWDFADNGITQTAVGIVLVAIGALISAKTAMVIAFLVCLFAAYRVGLFDHKELKHKIASIVGVPLVLALGLVLIWTVAWRVKVKAENGSDLRNEQGNKPTTASPQQATTPIPTSPPQSISVSRPKKPKHRRAPSAVAVAPKQNKPCAIGFGPGAHGGIAEGNTIERIAGDAVCTDAPDTTIKGNVMRDINPPKQP